MNDERPPFRADHVGSLLRPAAVRDARAKYAKGEIDQAALTAVEDEHVKRLIAKEESLGLKSVTDGEMRREAWTTDFLQEIDGVECVMADAVKFQGAAAHRTKVTRVTGKLGYSGHPMIRHFKFLKEHTGATPKMTIPAPTMLASASRDWRDIVDRTVYPTLDEMFHDLGLAYRKAIRDFADAGCRYLQLDDCSLAFACDAAVRQKMQARGDDPNAMLERWVALLNSALAEKLPSMTVSTHICRGNFRSTWMAQGGYEPIAETLFNRINFDAYFLEYDSDRAGGFEPLRFLPKNSHKKVVLGLITSKTGVLEDKDTIKRRIDQATTYVDLSRLCLSPQCGFASTEEGNELAEEQQWAKLRLAVEVADEVWGQA